MSNVQTMFCDKCGKIMIQVPGIKRYAIKKKYVSFIGYEDIDKIEYDFCMRCWNDISKYLATPSKEKRWEDG